MRRCLLTASLLLIWVSVALAYLTDALSHLPPSCGVYSYDGYTPASTGFPGIGGVFFDPIFGEHFTRLTNIYPSTTGSPIIYGVNGRWNADKTAYIHNLSGTTIVMNPQTGATIRSGVPYPSGATGEMSFDPVNPDIYYYTSGTSLMQYSISSNASTTVKNFGSTLGGLGQSGDWIDKTGTYFLLNIASTFRVWKKSTDQLYTGSIPQPSDIPNGWAGISPDGNYVILVHAPTAAVPWPKESYAVNHGTTTLATTGVMFWDACNSDHGDVMTASDGNTYMIVCQNSYTFAGQLRHLFRVLVTNNASGQGSAQLMQTGNQMLMPILAGNTAGNGDMGCAATGTWQDWCYANVADPTDLIGNQGTWYAYKSEMVLIHMMSPFEVRRIMHHRARPHRGYCRQVRVNPSWDGTQMMFTTPMSVTDSADCGYSDLWRYDATP